MDSRVIEIKSTKIFNGLTEEFKVSPFIKTLNGKHLKTIKAIAPIKQISE